ncbi:hypothetical protein [Sphingomonas sp.]|uniref:hypothetical protein n=1 Tax=Sphingomonas sp. TaxID=28214 RepID=UPI003D6D6DEC
MRVPAPESGDPQQDALPSVEYPAGFGPYLVTGITQSAQHLFGRRHDIGKCRESGRAAGASERDNLEPSQIDHRAAFFAHAEHRATVGAAGEDQRALAAAARTAWLFQAVMGYFGHVVVPGKLNAMKQNFKISLFHAPTHQEHPLWSKRTEIAGHFYFSLARRL